MTFKVIKVDDFNVIQKGVSCHFLLVINSNLGGIAHRIWDMANFLLKTHIFTPSLQSPMFPLH